jgi:UDP-N-acetylmuramate dehydrogenase
MLAMRTEIDETTLMHELRAIAGIKVKLAEPLARYTSIKIGGPAQYFIEVESETALSRLLSILNGRAVAFCLLGNGSNVLISDDGVEGAVIHLTGDFKRAEWRARVGDVWVEVGAAHAVTNLVRQAARRGYGGLEFAEGIPGTVGGALVMNAGAYGSEFEKVVDMVYAMSRDGSPVELSREAMTFSYRDSHLPQGTVVTRVRLSLQHDESSRLGTTVRELVTRRKSSQPSGHPNSGSMFRNPPGDHAGRLIEAAGLKGRQIGQAQISVKHGNFIVNLGGAKAGDVRQLMQLAQAEVKARFGVALMAEVKMLGKWPALETER